MKVYLKIHHKNEIETIACCDESLLRKVLKDGNLKFEITEQFFCGSLMNIDDAIEILNHAQYFNIVGKNITKKVISHNILPKEGIRTINGIPMGMKMMF
ncbi:MAG: DUF424 family protein [Promethearchaeota archaeon]